MHVYTSSTMLLHYETISSQLSKIHTTSHYPMKDPMVHDNRHSFVEFSSVTVISGVVQGFHEKSGAAITTNIVSWNDVVKIYVKSQSSYIAMIQQINSKSIDSAHDPCFLLSLQNV